MLRNSQIEKVLDSMDGCACEYMEETHQGLIVTNLDEVEVWIPLVGIQSYRHLFEVLGNQVYVTGTN